MVLRAGNARTANVKLHEESGKNNERILFLNCFPFFSQHKDNLCSLQTYKQEYLNTYNFTNQRKIILNMSILMPQAEVIFDILSS